MSEYKSKSLEKEEVKFTTKDPHGWIQWQGTDVCVDIRCKCGWLSHYDGDFMYFIKCPHCGQIYEVNGHIELIPVEKPFDENEHNVKHATE